MSVAPNPEVLVVQVTLSSEVAIVPATPAAINKFLLNTRAVMLVLPKFEVLVVQVTPSVEFLT